MVNMTILSLIAVLTIIFRQLLNYFNLDSFNSKKFVLRIHKKSNLEMFKKFDEELSKVYDGNKFW